MKIFELDAGMRRQGNRAQKLLTISKIKVCYASASPYVTNIFVHSSTQYEVVMHSIVIPTLLTPFPYPYQLIFNKNYR